MANTHFFKSTFILDLACLTVESGRTKNILDVLMKCSISHDFGFIADIHNSVKVQIGKGNIQFEIMELCYSDKRAGKRANYKPLRSVKTGGPQQPFSDPARPL